MEVDEPAEGRRAHGEVPWLEVRVISAITPRTVSALVLEAPIIIGFEPKSANMIPRIYTDFAPA
jgi:hypothetical protein